MAPRPPEPLDMFLSRLKNASGPVRFGCSHHTHVVCFEAQCVQLRKLAVPEGAREEFMAKHGYWMPENAEDLSEPADLVQEFNDLDAFIAFVSPGWPKLPPPPGSEVMAAAPAAGEAHRRGP